MIPRIALARLDRTRQAWRSMLQSVREDHAMMRHYDAKYDGSLRAADTSLSHDLVTRIGFQMLAAYRLMRFCVAANVPFAPRVVSRLIRHAYGSDIHWDAQFEPGIVVVHGMGLSVSRAARVDRGAILFQHVTLGMGTDPVNRAAGAPIVERDVHVGAGSTLIGPITVGARSKVTANCLVRSSGPPDSLVEAPEPIVSPRTRQQPRSRSAVDG